MIAVDILKQFEFFKGFSESELKQFAEIAIEDTYRAGFKIWEGGDQAKNLCLLEEGKVVLVMDTYMGTAKPPMQVTVDIVTKGEAMGWSAVVEPHLYTLGALCIADSKAIVFDGSKLRNLLNQDSALGFKFMHATTKVIASRLTHTEIILIGERGLSILS